MLAARNKVLYGGGNQTVYWIPRHNGEVRVATSPTYGIFDYREGQTASERTVVAAATAATVGTETETLAAAAGPSTADAKQIQVTDASDFDEGHVYILSEKGQTEAFVLDRKDETNEYLYAKAPLQKAWTTAAIVDAVELQATFPSTEADDEDETAQDQNGPYGIVWVYTVDGERHQDFQEIWVTRHSTPSLIDETDIKRADPKLASVLTGRYSLSDLCVLATEDYLADVRAAGKMPENFRPSTARTALRHKALEIAYEWKNNLEMSDRHREDYMRLMNQILVGPTPHGTTVIDEHDNTAPAGTDETNNPGLLRRS